MHNLARCSKFIQHQIFYLHHDSGRRAGFLTGFLKMVTFRSILSISGNAGGVVKIRNIRQRGGNPVKTFLLHISVDGHRPCRSLSRTSLNDRGFGTQALRPLDRIHRVRATNHAHQARRQKSGVSIGKTNGKSCKKSRPKHHLRMARGMVTSKRRLEHKRRGQIHTH